MRKNTGFYIGLILTSAIALMALTGCVYTPFGPEEVDGTAKFLSPGLKHLFGTDNLGRDVFSRCMKGVGTTMLISLSVVGIGLFFGIIVGAFTGYFGGIVDEILMRINDVMASFPNIFLALVFVSIFESSEKNVIIVLGILFIPGFARVVRGEYKKEREKEYVKSMRLYGAGHIRIMFVHILPNIRHSLVSSAAIGINNAILAEAGLSYLGVGVQPPVPSLGRMLSEGQTYIYIAPWNCIFPGGMIVLAVMGISLISEGFENSEHGLERLKKSVIKKYNNNRNKIIYEEGENSNKERALDVRGLSVAVNNDGKLTEVVHDVSFFVEKGEILGILGESGSGKSLSMQAVMGLLGSRAIACMDKCELNGTDLTMCSNKELVKLRGKNIAQVFQEPMTSLNPSKKIRWQLEEILRNKRTEKCKYDELLDEALTEAGIEEKERILDSYPSEISGGQRQRILIAMAILLHPELVIFDEPTTALDASVAEKIIESLRNLHKKYGMSIIFVSHDIKVVGSLCERILVMKDGRIIETGETEKILCSPSEEYTRELVEAGKGYAAEKTKEFGEEVLKLENVSVSYGRRSMCGKRNRMMVVDNLSFSVRKGQTIGILGESGKGKTTLLKAISGMVDYSGKIYREGRIAQVFQDPYSSLNPSMSVGRLLTEVVKINFPEVTASERMRLAEETIVSVGLDKAMLERMPSELSGGQRQRTAIAMAVISKPDIILLDEPVTALDATIQVKILKLLDELKRKNNLTYLIISHDEKLINNMCDGCIRV